MKKSNKGLIITIVILSILLASVSGYLVYDKFFNNEETKEEKNESSDKDTSNVSEELSINDSEVQKLYSYVTNGLTATYDTFDYFYRQDKLLATQMSDSDRLSLAAKLISEEDKKTTSSAYVSVDEEVIKANYNLIFGSSIDYRRVDFQIGCLPMEYNDETKTYVSTSDGCGGAVEKAIESLLEKAVKTNDSIEIYERMFVIVTSDGSFYKDTELKEKLNISNDDVINTDYDQLIKQHMSELNQYKYTFKKDNSGNYYFYSAELVK